MPHSTIDAFALLALSLFAASVLVMFALGYLAFRAVPPGSAAATPMPMPRNVRVAATTKKISARESRRMRNQKREL